MNDDLRAAAQAATPGPWHTLADNEWWRGGSGYRISLRMEDGSTFGAVAMDRDAEYLRLASPDRILGLCDDNKELRAALKSLTEAVEWIFAETDELTARGPMQRAHAKALRAL